MYRPHSQASTELLTKRLFLRLPLPGDGFALYQALQASRKELVPWIPWVERMSSPEQAEQGVQQAHVDFLQKKAFHFHLFEQRSGTFVGSCGLHHINWDVPRMEMGYWIDSRFAGKGYMTEAAKALMSYAFYTHYTHRLEIRCDRKNNKSRAIPEKLGFMLEATLLENERSPHTGELMDTCIYTAFHPSVSRPPESISEKQNSALHYSN
ncbi:ribosomal-protein-serine acetyltransferase [Shouchella clausii]|uniref:GNAT family N-acetyltransferase n=1 Tax=Shouchella TaxID=2893057 RepID=UPI001B0B8DCD|nr:GNAT family N-acetyltransferase [Shouchella clausii]MDO7284534.1 GNAT family N-acetyltransferase [Shouchella clausii]MDO7304629.1 GNAT family N-acetyltransferase [Shouchella clausii]GIN16232.1 ribosomal-protein-serine acetyltransferase [Shouchella clausii]